jgi:hypothetical protein
MEFSKTKINTSGQQFIQVDEKTWDEMGFVSGRRTGFIEVKPELADGILTALKGGEVIANFQDKNAATGLYEVVVMRKATV